MAYDLSPLFTLIASASATIVAIVGGFIASKLISLSAERTEVGTKLNEVTEELDFLTNECVIGQERIDEEDALDYIHENIEDLLECKELCENYEDNKKPYSLSKEILSEYWAKAIFLHDKLLQSFEKECKLNDDKIPTTLAKELTSNFDYEVCEMLVSEIQRQKESESYTIITPKFDRITGVWYQTLLDDIDDIQRKICWLEIQKKQLETRCIALEKPKGMKIGLFIITTFAITSIIIPMLWLDYSTTIYKNYLIANVVAIGVFSLNLMSIIGYFIYLLRWKKRKNNI